MRPGTWRGLYYGGPNRALFQWQGHWFPSDRSPCRLTVTSRRCSRCSCRAPICTALPAYAGSSPRAGSSCPSRGIQKTQGRASTHPAWRVWNVNPSICFFAGYRNALVVIQRGLAFIVLLLGVLPNLGVLNSFVHLPSF